MTRQTQLDIVWDGPIPSLSEHRVSLSLFGPALTNLLTATRRIASNMVSKALEPAETGRLAKEAHQIDIELGQIVGSSGGVATVMTFQSPDPQQPLFNDLTEAVGIEFLEAIESEVQGHFKNASVRRYLQSLPSSLKRQTYNLHENGREIKRITVGEMNLPQMEFDLPELKELVGRVIGVGFDPAPNEVRLRTQEGQITASATSKQVQQALDLRETTVRVVILSSLAGDRLLYLEDSTLVRYRPDQDYFLYKKWEKALSELA